MTCLDQQLLSGPNLSKKHKGGYRQNNVKIMQLSGPIIHFDKKQLTNDVIIIAPRIWRPGGPSTSAQSVVLRESCQILSPSLPAGGTCSLQCPPSPAPYDTLCVCVGVEDRGIVTKTKEQNSVQVACNLRVWKAIFDEYLKYYTWHSPITVAVVLRAPIS